MELKNEIIEKIFELWYSGKKVKELCNQFNITYQPNLSFVKHFPPIKGVGSCQYCKNDLFAFRSDPSYFKKHGLKHNPESAHCQACGHKSGYCKCEGCLELQQMAKKLQEENEAKKLEKRAKDLEQLYQSKKDIDLFELSFLQLIHLYVLCYQSTVEDVALISPPSASENPLTPDPAWSKEIIGSLRDYICPFSESEKLLSFKEDGSIEWYGQEVFYRIKIQENPLHFQEYLLEQIRFELPYNCEEFKSLCERLLLTECLNYIQFQREEFNLPHQVGDKTTAFFKKALTKWRVDQIYSIIWKACKDALAYKETHGLPKQHASNAIIGLMDKYLDKVEVKGWEIKSYYRNNSIPQSTMNYVLLNKILSLSGHGIEYSLMDIAAKMQSFLEEFEEPQNDNEIQSNTDEPSESA